MLPGLCRLLWMISDGCNKQYTGLTPGLLAWVWIHLAIFSFRRGALQSSQVLVGDVQKELEKSGGAGQPGKGARLRLHYAGQSPKTKRYVQ